MAGIIVLLIGTMVWGVFGKIGEIDIESVVTIVRDGHLRCYVDEESLPVDEIPSGAAIKVASLAANSTSYEEYKAEKTEWIELPTEDPEEMRFLSQVGFETGENVMVLMCECELADGLYSSDITFAGQAPITLLDKN